MVPQRHRSCQKWRLWHLEAALFKCFLQSRVDPRIRRRQHPKFTGEVGQIDLAAACPQAMRISGNNEFVVEVLFNDELVIAADAHSLWARRRKVDLADLPGELWMLTPPDSWVYSRLKEAFEERGLKMPKTPLLTTSVPLRNHLLAD